MHRSPLAFTLPSAQQLQDDFRKYGVADDSLVGAVQHHAHHVGDAPVVDAALGGPSQRHAAGRWLYTMDRRRTADRHESHAVSDKQHDGAPAAGFVGDARRSARNRSATSAVCTINALSPEVYAGTAQMNYGRPGHIPGSKNLYYGSILDRQTFRSADEIAAAIDRVGAARPSRIITYCGGGISATVDAFALKLIGHDNVAVYDGSMSEWVRDPSLPLVTGDTP